MSLIYSSIKFLDELDSTLAIDLDPKISLSEIIAILSLSSAKPALIGKLVIDVLTFEFKKSSKHLTFKKLFIVKKNR